MGPSLGGVAKANEIVSAKHQSGRIDTTATQMTTSVRRILTEKTLIADVTDYALELYARERAEMLAQHPNAGGAPKWMLVGLVAVLVAVMAAFFALLAQGPHALFADSPLRTGALVGFGVLVVLTIVTILLHASKVGQLPAERIEELKKLDDAIKAKFAELGLKCYGCGAAYAQTFEQGAKIHGYDVDAVLRGIRELEIDLELTNPARPLPTPTPTSPAAPPSPSS